MLLFTFEDHENGELRSTIAPNEAAARLQLGGVWIDFERTFAWAPCEIDNLPDLYRQAEVAEARALREAEAADPMGKGRLTTPEALAKLSQAQEKHRKLKAHRRELMYLMASHRLPG
jgi:hypothetical protein